MEKAMKIKIALSLIFLIALSGVGINCDSSKGNKIAGPVSFGNPSNEGNALDIWSDKSKIGVGETATITTRIYNTGTYTGPCGNLITALSGYGCGIAGASATISVTYSINTHGTPLSAQSATLAGSTTTTPAATAGSYYFYSTLTGVTRGTAVITANHFEMQKTIYVDIE
ncbi:MAG: hypothetical protein HY279_09975, partial [Nitrospinae bacterium]|nr:hypothetical protein [Nitrospinota bacterium]